MNLREVENRPVRGIMHETYYISTRNHDDIFDHDDEQVSKWAGNWYQKKALIRAYQQPVFGGFLTYQTKLLW